MVTGVACVQAVVAATVLLVCFVEVGVMLRTKSVVLVLITCAVK